MTSLERLYIEKIELLAGQTIQKTSISKLIQVIKNGIPIQSNKGIFAFAWHKTDIDTINQSINSIEAKTLPEIIIKGDFSAADQINPVKLSRHLLVKLCLEDNLKEIIDKLETSDIKTALLQDICETLISIYESEKTTHLLINLQDILSRCDKNNCQELTKFYKKIDVDPNILRILHFFFKGSNFEKKISLNTAIKDPLLSKIGSRDMEITDLNILLINKCPILVNKISLFNQLSSSLNSDQLTNLLAISYIADRPFYQHLENAILNLDDFQLPFSDNPYIGKDNLLRDAISKLLNTIVTIEVQKKDLIEHMQSLTDQYSSVIMFKDISSDNDNAITHPILELFQNKKWKQIDEWIAKTPTLLMMSDIANNIPLISKILLSKGDDTLINLQKLAIDRYLSEGLYRSYNNQNDPYIQTFIEYQSSKEPNNPLKFFNDKIMYGDFERATFISQSPAFKFICELGEISLISSLKDKLQLQDNRSRDSLKSLIAVSINSLWYSNDQKSDPASAKTLRQATALLNEMITLYTEKPVVKMEIKNEVDREYINLEFNQNITPKSSLELSFVDGNIQIENLKKINNYYDLIDLYNNTILTIGNQFLWYSGKIQIVDPALYIKFSLLNLGHPDNHSEDKNRRQENLHQAFNDLFNKNPKHPFFNDLTNATSDLWSDIYNLGYERGKALLQYFLPEKTSTKSLLEYFLPTNGPRESPQQFFFGQNKTLQTFVLQETLQTFLTKKLTEDDYYQKKCIISRFIKSSILMNDLDGMINWIQYGEATTDIIEHSLAIAVGVLNTDAINKLLENYPRAIIDNHNEYAQNLFTVLYEHSQSQLMNDDKSYRNSVNAVAVKLLEYGYPIDLVESVQSNQKTADFMKDLLSAQVNYSIKMSAISWISNSLHHIPFVNVIAKCGSDVLKIKAGQQFYSNIYAQSRDLIQERLSTAQENKIDISKFCYIFSSKLQEIQAEDFINKLENITFLKNVKKDSFDRQSLVSSAQALSRAVPSQFNQYLDAFNVRIPQPITSQEISTHTSNKEIYSIAKSLENNFFLYKLSLYKANLPIVVNSKQNNVCATITNSLANIGAGVITAGAFLFNESYQQNNTSMFMICTAMMSFVHTNSRVFYRVLSIAISYYILQKLYQHHVALKNSTPHQWTAEELQKLDNKSVENTIQKISDEKIYSFIKSLFNSFIHHELIPQEMFFKLMKRFGIEPHKLSNAIDLLKSHPHYSQTSEAIIDITSAMSIPAIYLNLQLQDKILRVLSQHYEIKKHELYLDFFFNCQKIEISPEQMHQIKNDFFMNFIFNLSKQLKNCKEIEDVVIDTHTQMIIDQSQCSSQKSTYIS